MIHPPSLPICYRSARKVKTVGSLPRPPVRGNQQQQQAAVIPRPPPPPPPLATSQSSMIHPGSSQGPSCSSCAQGPAVAPAEPLHRGAHRRPLSSPVASKATAAEGGAASKAVKDHFEDSPLGPPRNSSFLPTPTTTAKHASRSSGFDGDPSEAFPARKSGPPLRQGPARSARVPRSYCRTRETCPTRS